MRPSRVAKETSRFFDSSATPVLPRRSTRVSLARFAYNGANANPPSAPTAAAPEQADAEVTVGSDIEDAVKPAVQRKRKRTATVAQPSPRRVSTRARTTRTEIKTEVKTEVKNETKSEIKSDPDSDAEDVKPETTTPAKPRGRVRKPARTTTDPTTGTTTVHPPTDWEQTYAVAKEMRLTGLAANAAVDTMGCERLADPNASARDRRFQTLVALMLSSQTKDTVNAAAMARLRTELPPHTPGAPPGLNLENMLAVDPVLLNELIGKVGFHNNKTKYLKTTASILQSHHASDIPPTIAGLTSLPGVGPKMAHLCMSATNGWNRVEGIGVDVHVHRITNLWGWQSPPTKTPEETRKALESWLPRDKWKEINWLLVGLGQTVCAPVGRKCGDCEVGLAGLCKGADRGRLAEGRRRRGVVKGEEVGVKVEGLKTEGVKVEDEDGVKMEGVEEKVKVEEGVEMEEGVELEEAKMEKVKAEGDQVDEDQVGEVKMEGVEMQGVKTGEVEEKGGGIRREETKEGVEIEEAKVQEGMKMESEDDAEMEGVELEGAKVEGLKVEGVKMEKVKVEGGENKGQVEDEDGGVVIKKEEAIGFEQVQRVVKVSSPSVKEEDIGN